MKTLDSLPLVKASRIRSKSDQEFIDEHDGEFDDLVYEESVGRRESWEQGSMLGSPNVFRP